MSTKLSNEHITRISQECKEYKIFDVYIILAHISSEVKSGKYLIQSYSSKRSDLINIVLIQHIKQFQTVLINLKI